MLSHIIRINCIKIKIVYWSRQQHNNKFHLVQVFPSVSVSEAEFKLKPDKMFS